MHQGARQGDDALRKNEERLRSALASSHLGSWEWDIPMNKVTWSDMVESIFCLSPGTFDGTYTGYLELIHPEDRSDVLGTIERLLEGEGVDYAVIHRTRASDGSLQWIEANGQLYRDEEGTPLRLLGTVKNITEEKRRETLRLETEHALRQSEERFRSMMYDSPIGTAIVAPDGRWIDVNPSLCEIIGYTRDELLVTDVQSVTHPDDLEEDLEQAYQLLDGKINKYQIEKRYVHKDGRSIRVQLNTSLVRHLDGTPRHFIAHIQDITQRHQLEEQHRQTQRMESIGQLAGGIAHDFNNIIAAILMQAEMAALHEANPEATNNLLKDIKLSAQRASELTRQLLLFGRKQVMHMRVVDLNNVVLKLSKMLQRLLREDIHIEMKLHSSPLPVNGDTGMLDQILINLSVNARDAMPKGGNLDIETFPITVKRGLAPASRPDLEPGQYVCLRVRDTGAGIDPADMPNIFDPFFTTKEEGKGTGLGLATVFGIVKQHGGTIHVDSEPDAGATFDVIFPMVVEAALESDPAVAEGKVVGGTQTILLVEDNEAVRAIARQVMQGHGYTVLESASGREAIAAWSDPTVPIDLLITDLVMPGGVSGFDLALALYAKRPNLKVIFMSGYSVDLAGHALELSEGQQFMQKPFTADQLMNEIRTMLHAG